MVSAGFFCLHICMVSSLHWSCVETKYIISDELMLHVLQYILVPTYLTSLTVEIWVMQYKTIAYFSSVHTQDNAYCQILPHVQKKKNTIIVKMTAQPWLVSSALWILSALVVWEGTMPPAVVCLGPVRSPPPREGGQAPGQPSTAALH